MFMSDERLVHQVSVQQPGGGFNLLDLKTYFAIPLSERTKLILASRVYFLSDDGDSVPLLEAIRWLKANPA